jgi:imidazolonepropionase-like amidohydrolase
MCRFLSALASFCALLLIPACATIDVLDPSSNDPDSCLALIGGTIYRSPDQTPIRNGIILIRGETITAVGPEASIPIPTGCRSIDCSGLTITAGFWNCHVHFLERKWQDAATIPADDLRRQLEAMITRYGFTSVFDLSSEWANTRALRDRIDSGEVPGPRIRSTGEGLIPPGALPPKPVLRAMGFMPVPLPEITDAATATAAARALLDAGVDGIKLFASSTAGFPLAPGAIEAAASEAHRRGRPIFVHPNSTEDVLAAVRGGADVIAHTTPNSGPWDESVLAAMSEARVALTPTLTLWKHVMRHDRISTQETLTNTAVGQLRAWSAAGGTVLFGTDLGAVDPDPTDEYALMAEAGMTFPQILASLTTAPAERFGESERLGRIAPGYEADLVVLDGDPSEHLAALMNVRYTLRAGSVISRADEH